MQDIQQFNGSGGSSRIVVFDFNANESCNLIGDVILTDQNRRVFKNVSNLQWTKKNDRCNGVDEFQSNKFTQLIVGVLALGVVGSVLGVDKVKKKFRRKKRRR